MPQLGQCAVGFLLRLKVKGGRLAVFRPGERLGLSPVLFLPCCDTQRNDSPVDQVEHFITMLSGVNDRMQRRSLTDRGYFCPSPQSPCFSWGDGHCRTLGYDQLVLILVSCNVLCVC